MQFHLTEMRQGENEKALQGITWTIETNISKGAHKTDSLFSSACIYRVPKELRKRKESAYTPRLIAIGPLHRKDKHLKTSFQGVKKSYTNSLLLRLKYYEYPKVLQECVQEMKDCVDQARKCYTEELDVSDDHMLEMMLVDGCFILELLYKFDELKSKTKEAKNTPKEEGQEGKRNGASTSSDLSTPLLQVPSTRLLSTSSDLSIPLLQASRGATRMQTPLVGESEIKTSCGTNTIDPIRHCNLIATTVKHDLLLLENQIPFFVLEKLFSLTVGRIQNNRLHKLDHYVFQYFGIMMSGSPSDSTVVWIPPNQMQRDYYHILHKLHEYYLPQTEPTEKELFKMIMPCASELDYAAVKFEPFKGKGLFKADFSPPKGPFWWCHRASFKIPILQIYDQTELILRNLIAFEQCCPGVSQPYFTSYAFLMDMLINSEKDVQVLEQAEVICNYLGARADATNLFNNLCKEVALDPTEFFFADKCSQATAYSKRPWPKKLAGVKRTYFASPRTFIAFFVAFIAFAIQIVTFVQSFL